VSDPYAATRQVYDKVAADYARLVEGHLATNIWDRAVLTAFAEHVMAAGGGQVLDLGCGPGHITAHLAELGLDVAGVDLSPAMVAEARRRFPALSFSIGRLDAPAVAAESLGGLLAWYSLIHVPPDDLLLTMRTLASALRPGGHLQLAFQVGDGHRHITHAWGHDLDLDAWLPDPDRITAQLCEAGLEVITAVRRAPEEPERSTQAYLLARKRRPTSGTLVA
jgi:SAM-dependent methyltransferase